MGLLIRNAVADTVLLDFMTKELSKQLAMRMQWLNMSNIKPYNILRDLLPRVNRLPPVPSPPWMFAYPPALLQTQQRWWEAGDQNKPAWWEEPDPEVCS